METFSSIWSILSVFLVFSTGYFTSFILANKFSLTKKRALTLYIWHTLFCLAYVIYSTYHTADAIMYYLKAIEGDISFKIGTPMVSVIAWPFANFLSFSYLSVNLVFNIFGFIGLLAFDSSLRHATLNKPFFIKRLASWIVFLPSISFWSSAIGKDSIAFMCVSLALWSSIALDKRLLLMAFSIALLFLFRPHISAFMMLALFGSVFLTRHAIHKKVFISILLFFSASSVFYFVAGYIRIEPEKNLDDYIALRQSFNLGGGSSLDISSMSFLLQLFTYLFRPLPFEANNIFSFFSSLDNLTLLALLLFSFTSILKKIKYILSENIFIIIYIFPLLSMLAMTTANLGIAIRQKWMVWPMLIYIIFSVVEKHKPLTSHTGKIVKK